VIYRMFVRAMDTSIVAVAGTMPKNLRQYFANQLMLMRVRIEFGITGD
jgi:hypothetical protein